MSTTVTTQEELISILQEEIRETNKGIKVIAGHAPMRYNNSNSREVWVDLDRWGEFSPYTFSLGCEIAKYALDQGKDVGIVVIVDDLVEMPRDSENRRREKAWMPRYLKRFYGQDYFPKEFDTIARWFEVNDNIVSQERTLGPSKLISERRAIGVALSQNKRSPNECSLAYNAILDDKELFRNDYIISFVPGQCKGNVCEGVLDIRKDIDSTHIFFPHVEDLGGIVQTQQGFVDVWEGITIKEAYEQGRVSYRKTKSN